MGIGAQGQIVGVPSAAELSQYKATYGNEYEVNTQALYDQATYPIGGLTQLLLFQQQIGTGQGGVTTKTVQQTNMSSNGLLANPVHFLVTSVELDYLPGVPIDDVDYINDVRAFADNGALEFQIGDKVQLTEAPLGKFPPKTGVKVFSSGALDVAHAQMVGRPYYLDVPLLIIPMQNFNVKLTWETPLPMPSGTAGRVRVRLDGLRYRSVQ